METKLTFLRGIVAAPAHEMSRANTLIRHRRFETSRKERAPGVRARPTLRMIWRTHPISGRLQCLWAVDNGSATDEGDSCRDRPRRASWLDPPTSRMPAGAPRFHESQTAATSKAPIVSESVPRSRPRNERTARPSRSLVD